MHLDEEIEEEKIYPTNLQKELYEIQIKDTAKRVDRLFRLKYLSINYVNAIDFFLRLLLSFMFKDTNPLVSSSWQCKSHHTNSQGIR